MPNVKSAEKRVRTNEKRRLRNRADKATLRTTLKSVMGAAQAKDLEALKKIARQAQSVIGKSRRKTVINRRRAARLQSRVQRIVNRAQAAPAPAAPAAPAEPAPAQ